MRFIPAARRQWAAVSLVILSAALWAASAIGDARRVGDDTVVLIAAGAATTAIIAAMCAMCARARDRELLLLLDAAVASRLACERQHPAPLRAVR